MHGPACVCLCTLEHNRVNWTMSLHQAPPAFWLRAITDLMCSSLGWRSPPTTQKHKTHHHHYHQYTRAWRVTRCCCFFFFYSPPLCVSVQFSPASGACVGGHRTGGEGALHLCVGLLHHADSVHFEGCPHTRNRLPGLWPWGTGTLVTLV